VLYEFVAVLTVLTRSCPFFAKPSCQGGGCALFYLRQCLHSFHAAAMLPLPPPPRVVAVLYEGYQPVDCGPESGPADQIRATTHKKAVMALGGAAAGKDLVAGTTGEWGEGVG
jgi:hypothetical protein